MPDDRPQTPHIRGQERADLVDALARAEETHEQLAERFGGRHKQAISQFASRNKAEIQGRRQVLHGALAEETKHLWVADKVKVAERYQDTIDDLYADFQATEDPTDEVPFRSGPGPFAACGSRSVRALPDALPDRC
jgi:hypothetical protein